MMPTYSLANFEFWQNFVINEWKECFENVAFTNSTCGGLQVPIFTYTVLLATYTMATPQIQLIKSLLYLIGSAIFALISYYQKRPTAFFDVPDRRNLQNEEELNENALLIQERDIKEDDQGHTYVQHDNHYYWVCDITQLLRPDPDLEDLEEAHLGIPMNPL